eukprot:TRINITY_DN18398_c0_g1_i1.p1 TRINITY_DN18398_c0_g1~~TRINITY_DN18398_c0_g1_i1.p1  ORF type:complete len:1334 (-),score=215.70 TRINITY_DN18398_c0_g1_i1:74-4075(-)
MCSRGDGAYELSLGAAHGRIWERRPRLTGEGVLLRALNTRRRENDPLPVPFVALAFSGDGQAAAAADKRGHLYILYLQLNRYSLIDRESPGPRPGALCFTRRRHEEVLCSAKCTVRAFDADTHRQTAVLRGHQREVTTICACGPAGLVLTQSADVAILWDVQDWSKRRSLQAVSSPMHEVCFSPLGDLCGVLFRDSRVVLWRTTTLACEAELSPEEQSPGAEKPSMRHLALNARYVVTAGACGLILIWTLARLDQSARSAELERPAIALALDALRWDTGSVADAAYALQDDGRLLVVDLSSFEVKLALNLQSRAITAFAVDCHSEYLLLAASDGSVEVRDVARAYEHERRALEQRVQLGAPAELLRTTLRRPASSGMVWPTAAKVQLDGSSSASSSPYDEVKSDRLREMSQIDEGQHGEQGDAERRPAVARSPRSSRTRNAVPSPRRGNSQPMQSNVPSRNVVQQSSEVSCDDIDGIYNDGARDRFDAAASSAQPDLRAQPVGQRSAWHERDQDVTYDLATGHPQTGTSAGEALPGEKLRRLRSRLSRCGEYPDEERPRIWRTLLQLPHNRKAYEDLEAMGVHPKYRDLQEQYPAHTRGTIHRLTRLLSALAHWSQLWVELRSLPALAFPFLKVLGGDPVVCFEAVATVLLNWARGWVAELPGLPLAILTRLDDLLATSEPALHRHLRLVCSSAHERSEHTSRAAVHHVVLWPLLRTLLTEAMHKEQWLQLWDHLIAHWQQPELLHAAIVAFLHVSRASLLELPAHSPGQLDAWLRRPRQVHMPTLIEIMFSLQGSASATLPASLVAAPLLLPSPGNGAFAGGGSWMPELPLPRGRYPSFSGFPYSSPSSFAYNSHPVGADRCGDAAAHLRAHRDQMLEIRSCVESLCVEEARFRAQQEELLRAEEARRKIAAEEEDRLLEERRQADERLLQKRLQQVKQMFTGFEDMMKQQQVARSMEGNQLVSDLKRRHKERSYEIEARLKEEAVLNLEAQGMQSLSELLHKRRDEENRRSLETLIRGRRRELELQDLAQHQQWRVEDERERARLLAIREQQLEQEQREAQLARQREVEMELRLEELERQVQLAQVARERLIRKVKQDAACAKEEADKTQRRRHELASINERREQALVIGQERRILAQHLRERQEMIERETHRWRMDADAKDESLRQASSEQARRDYEVRAAQLRQEDHERAKADEERLLRELQHADGVLGVDPAADGGWHLGAAGKDLAGENLPDQVGGNTWSGLQSSSSGIAAAARAATAAVEPGRREQQLEDLIKQREAELEALWRNFDEEARELSETEGLGPVVDSFSAAAGGCGGFAGVGGIAGGA